MHFFFQGPRRAGKSTLLRSALAPYASSSAGLAVQRLLEGDGRQAGFQALAFAGAIPPVQLAYRPGLSGVFLLRGAQFPAVLEGAVLECARLAALPQVSWLLLDEIGGVELANPLLFRTLLALLEGPKPCAGVFKSEENWAHTLSVLGPMPQVTARRLALREAILARGELAGFSPSGHPLTRLIHAPFWQEVSASRPRSPEGGLG